MTELAGDMTLRAMRLTATGTLTHGLPVRDVLGVSTLADARVVAGERGLGRAVQRLNVMEVPDILPWVKPHELLLTTGYPLRDTPERLVELIGQLADKGLAAMAIKLGRYLDALPEAMLAEADRLEFPIIQLPDDVGFDDILNQVLTDILNRQAGQLARAQENHQALLGVVLAGGGMAELVRQVAGQLGAVVTVSDASGRQLARWPEGQAGAFAGPVPMMTVPIVVGGVGQGVVACETRNRAPDAADRQVLEGAATVAALVIAREQAVAAVEGKYQADFLRDILDQRSGDPWHAVEHARSLGWDLDRPLMVAVAQLDHVDGEQRRRVQTWMTTELRRTLRRSDPGAVVAGYAQEIVAVVGATDPAVATGRLRAAAEACASMTSTVEQSFSLGLSRAADGPGGLSQAYHQACTARKVGVRVSGPGSRTTFDELGVFRLLSLVQDGRELRSFLFDTLGPLVSNDAASADLRHTLGVLLDTNINVAETARRLHYHYNTLRYRIEKLERHVGPFTTDPNLRLNLSVALAVMRMHRVME